MNPTAIYSKSGKGVQEASGKTSTLSRADRAVLAAIDGKATVADIAQKIGKPFDAVFEQLIARLDNDGYIRAVSAGVAAPAASSVKPAAMAAAAPADAGEDLDFSSFAPPPPKPAEVAQAKDQTSSLNRARLEAEARAQKERERIKAEAEAKLRAEAEAKLRAQAAEKGKADLEAKLRAEADAKIKAAREAAVRAAAEAKAKADAERAKLEAERAQLEAERKAHEEAERKAREEAERARREAEEKAERARKEAEEKAERARKEAEEKAAREAEELRRKLEEERARAEVERRAREEAERKAREEAERKAKEQIERARREAEEKARQEAEALRRQLEEERRKLEEARRRQEEERQRREEEDRARRAAEETARQEAEERARKEAEGKARRDAEERERVQAAAARAKTSAQPTGEFSDSLLAELDSFDKREDEERRAKEDAERRAREDEERKAREERERKAREDADRRRLEQQARDLKAEQERRLREDEERKLREEEEKRRKVQEALASVRGEAPAGKPGAAAAARTEIDDMDDIGVTDDDLDMEDVKRDERALSAGAKRAAKEREREEREAAEHAAEPAAPVRERRRIKWGKPVAATLFVLLAAGLGWIHVMPLNVAEYEAAATEALGAPVRIGSGRLSLFTGVQATFDDVTVGESKVGRVRAVPEIGTLLGPKKAFSRIAIDGPVVRQEALGGLLFAKSKGERFQVGRIVVTNAKLEGPLALPALDADIAFGPDGSVRSATLRGAEGLVAKLTPKDNQMEFEVSAAQFTVPIAPQVTLGNFGMRGTATRQEMRIAAWDGTTLDGNVAGSGVIRWGSTWQVDGAFTVRGINAAVFAPALLSEGKAEGSGKFSLNGAEPAKLIDGGRIEGSFTIAKGALGSVDLSRALQTGGRQASGRTPFAEMTGQGVYEKGMVQLRNVTIGAGALNAGASADINPAGAISGRIVADVKTASQTLRASFNLGGTVRDPQVKN